MDFAKPLKIAATAARRAGVKAKELRDSSAISISSKADFSLVTSGDYASDEIIREAILSEYPDHLILSEESVESWKHENFSAPHLWIVDPIDGTTNYVYGQPHAGVSVAYAQNGVVVAAAVYSIFIDELFYAVKGGGAFLNDKPIQVNETDVLAHSLVATGFPYQRPIEPYLGRQIIAVTNACRDLRRTAAASLDLCWVACGRLDAYFESVQPWDMAAGGLVVREAGGVVSTVMKGTVECPPDLTGEHLIASCPKIAEDLKKLLAEA